MDMTSNVYTKPIYKKTLVLYKSTTNHVLDIGKFSQCYDKASEVIEKKQG